MKKSSFVLVILAGVFWGTLGIFTKNLNAYGVTPLHIVFIRAFVSVVLLGAFLLLYNKKLFCIKWKEFLLVLGGGTGLFFTAFFYNTAIIWSKPSTAVVLMYTAPIFVAIYSMFFLGEKMTSAKGAAIGLMLIGCALVSGVVTGFEGSFAGILMGLGSGVAYSIYNIFTKYEVRSGIHPITATFYAYVIMLAWALFTASPQKLVPIVSEKPSLLLWMLAAGIFTTVLPYLLYTFGMAGLTAGTATSLGVVEVLAASVYSLCLGYEKADAFSILGIVLMIFAVVLLGFIEDRISKKEKQEKTQNDTLADGEDV